MRITAAEKEATRKRILDTAKQLFRTKGFDQATTRDIAQEVGIANGTMFNYFASKEAIVVELANVGLEKAAREFSKHQPGGSLEEDLFAFIAIQLRHLRSVRKYLRPLLDTVFVPTGSEVSSTAADIRSDLNERMGQILHDHGHDQNVYQKQPYDKQHKKRDQR